MNQVRQANTNTSRLQNDNTVYLVEEYERCFGALDSEDIDPILGDNILQYLDVNVPKANDKSKYVVCFSLGKNKATQKFTLQGIVQYIIFSYKPENNRIEGPITYPMVKNAILTDTMYMEILKKAVEVERMDPNFMKNDEWFLKKNVASLAELYEKMSHASTGHGNDELPIRYNPLYAAQFQQARRNAVQTYETNPALNSPPPVRRQRQRRNAISSPPSSPNTRPQPQPTTNSPNVPLSPQVLERAFGGKAKNTKKINKKA